MIRKLAVIAVALGAALPLAACGNAAPKPSVAACTQAYPAWFAASAAAGKTTAVPAACEGLSQDQVASIAWAYLEKLAQRGQ
jgi:hypothetical protein